MPAAVQRSERVRRRPRVRHKDALAGVDPAGNEAGYPAALFAPAFRLTRESGRPATIHAGEAAGPRSVWAAGVRVALCTDNPVVSDTGTERGPGS